MNARERFERTRNAVTRLQDVKYAIMYDCDDWKPEGVRVSGKTSDPTAAQAIRNVDELADKLAALRLEEDELETFIGESLAIIAAVRRGFGDVYANLLEWRYIDGVKWTVIADKNNKTARTMQLWAQVVFDWIDSIGVSRLLNGQVEL